MKRIKLFFVLFISISFFTCGYVAAEEKKKNQVGEVFELGEIVVTGQAEVISKVATIETVNLKDMQLNNSNDVASALDNMTGLAISVGSRNESYINVRGFNQRYVPIYYDGIPWYIPNDGYVDPGEISTGNIARVTLTKGAPSTLYGANTMGGVINIVSLKPSGSFNGSFNLTLAEDKYQGSLNLGSMIGKFYVMGGVSGLDYDDFRMSDDYTPVPGSAENGKYREKSYKESFTGTLKFGLIPAEGHEYAIGFHTTESEKGWPPNVYPLEGPMYRLFPEWEKTTYYFIADDKILDHLSTKVRLFHDTYYNIVDAYDDATYSTQNTRRAFHSTYDDYTNGGSLIVRSDIIDNNIISFSYHIKDDTHREQDNRNAPWEKYKTQTSSYGFEDSIIVNDKLNLVAGINYDENKPKNANGAALRDDDNSWNSVIGMTYDFTTQNEFHASVAKKTRFPSQKELYSAYLGSNYPNPDLRKEEAVNYEAGILSAIPFDSNIDFTLFYSDVKDLIVTTQILVGTSRMNYNDNIGNASYRGAELSYNTTYFDKNLIQLAYSYIKAENETPGRTSDFIPEVPRHQLRLTDLITLNDKFSLFAKARYENGQKQETRSLGWIELDDYWVFDLKGIYNYSENIQFDISIQNILDENYSTSYGFPREGRLFVFGLKTTF